VFAVIYDNGNFESYSEKETGISALLFYIIIIIIIIIIYYLLFIANEFVPGGSGTTTQNNTHHSKKHKQCYKQSKELKTRILLKHSAGQHNYTLTSISGNTTHAQ
jgi:hypothetical protein